MATHRVRSGGMEKVCLPIGYPKNSTEGLELCVVSCVKPHQEPEGFVMESCRGCPGSQESRFKVQVKTGVPLRRKK